MIAGVILFILVPLAVAGMLSIFRRLQTIAMFIATGVSGALGVAALVLPLDRAVELGGRQVALGEPVMLLGRQLSMTGADRILLAFVFLAAAGLFLVGWRSGTGPLFFPAGMGTLGFLSAALVAHPFIYAVLSLTIGSVLATLLFASPGQTRGALRYLALTTLALPAFMVASWLVDVYAPNPIDTTLPRNIMLALAGGFTLLLSSAPFHIWIRPATEESPPIAVAFVLTVCNSVNWFLLLNVLQEFPWLVAQQDIFSILQLLGLLTTAVGGILAFSSRDFAHVLAYGVIADYGCALLTLGTRTPAGLTAVMFATLARPISLALLALGLTLARDRFQSTHFDKLTGLAWISPWMGVALTVGGFSLAGIPPLAGFLGRWAEVRLMAGAQPIHLIAVLGATFGVAAGTLRGLDYLLQPLPGSAGARDDREPRLMILLVILTLLAGLGLAFFPGALEPLLRTVVSSYTFFSAP